jgi:tetratricopeptide (TPR) repeat protein
MIMARSCAVYFLLGLLGPAAGCQLISRENLATTAESGPRSPKPPELPPKETAEVCRHTAEVLEQGGNSAEAIALYEKARQNGANKQQVSRRLAYLHEQQGDFQHALEEYKQLLQRSPKDADLLNDIGYCCYNQGDWVEAEKYLRQALAVSPEHGRAWINLGMTLAKTGRTTESIEAFTHVVSPAQAQCNLAFILTTQGQIDEAKAAYQQALDHEPDLNVARVALAKLEKAARSAASAPATAAPAYQPLPLTTPRNETTVAERLDALTPVEVPLP